MPLLPLLHALTEKTLLHSRLKSEPEIEVKRQTEKRNIFRIFSVEKQMSDGANWKFSHGFKFRQSGSWKYVLNKWWKYG